MRLKQWNIGNRYSVVLYRQFLPPYYLRYSTFNRGWDLGLGWLAVYRWGDR